MALTIFSFTKSMINSDAINFRTQKADLENA